MNRAARAAATLALLASALTAAAQPPDPAALRGESVQTRKRLSEIKDRIDANKTEGAADDIQRVIDESGNDLVFVDAATARPARWVAHQLLTRLPQGALKAYQDRVDQPAKKLLAQGKQDRDPRPLYQLLDRYFCSHPADEAILLLGDLLFERGQFREAESTWARLLPDGADLLYPNSKADPALVRARLVLAALFAGDTERARVAFDAFKTQHAKAAGALAGKTGPLADTLRTFFDRLPALAPEVPRNSWPTYGGNPERTGRVPGGIPTAWLTRPAWEQLIPQRTKTDPDFRNPPARPAFGHPVVLNGTVFVADASRVFGFDLHTGEPAGKYNAVINIGQGQKGPVPGQEQKLPDACASLTAADGLLFARFGPPTVRAPEKAEESYLYCLRPQGQELKYLWRLAPPEEPKVLAAWEGVPLVVGKRLWAVYAKFEAGRVVHVAACYDPVEGGTEPLRPAWVTELCDSALPASGEGRTRQELLTLAGRNLVFCSNAGAVVAVDAATGQRAWGFRYPRSRKAAAHPTGDPAPAVAFNGRVMVAPADGERVYALEAHSGQLVWESGPVEGARILGVARNHLIVSVTGPTRGLRGLALDTGSHRPSDGGWAPFVHPGVLGYGQGIVTDDVILWPSREGLAFVLPEKGQLAPGRPNPLPSPFPNFLSKYFGNLVYADGVLVVVTGTQVWGYRPESAKIVPRPTDTPRQRFDALVSRAEQKHANGARTEAMTDLWELATSNFAPPLRAWAAARLVQWSPKADRLPVIIESALTSDLLREWVLAPNGLPVALEAFVAMHLGQKAPAAVAPRLEAEAPPCAPALTSDSEVDHTLRLPHGVSPICPLHGSECPQKLLFAAGLDKIVTIPLDRSAPSEYRAPDAFTHAACLREGFVAAGPNAVALYHRAKDPVWVFRVPLTDRLPSDTPPFKLRSSEGPPEPVLSSFWLAGTWLLSRVGESHLIALDLDARRVVWVLCATGASGYEPWLSKMAPRFGPHFAVSGRFVVAQLSDGRRWFVSLATGRVAPQPALGDLTAKVNWPHPPAGAGENWIALADGPGLVRFAQLGGRVKWAYETEHPEGLTGTPPAVRVCGNSALIAVRRNYGIDIDLVNAADGKRAWEAPAFVDAFTLDMSSTDADADNVYVATADKLHAFVRADGASAWTAKLPQSSAGWVVRAGKSCVVAYPAQALPREDLETVWGRLRRSFAREPFLWRLPGLAATLYDAWGDRVLPVLLFDPETGKQVARYDVPARGPGVATVFDANAAVFATGDRVVWIK